MTNYRAKPQRRSSVPQEIDPAQLVAEIGAGFDRRAEIVFAEDVGFKRIGRDDGGVARLAAEQRRLAKEIAGAKPGDLVAGALDPDLAVRDQIKLVPGLAFLDHRLARQVVALG